MTEGPSPEVKPSIFSKIPKVNVGRFINYSNFVIVGIVGVTADTVSLLFRFNEIGALEKIESAILLGTGAVLTKIMDLEPVLSPVKKRRDRIVKNAVRDIKKNSS